jgi:phospholipid/cholesterol/gamma-HCH transport system substrate-binding protein
MNNTQMTARVGLFFIIGMALIWVTFEALHSNGVDVKHGNPLVAGFSTLKELKPGDEVRMAGVKVGAVETTRLARGRAEAVLRIEPQYKVAKDSVGTIAMAGLLGANYLSLTMGHPDAGVLGSGDELTTKDTGDLNQVMSDLGSMGDQLKGTLSEIGKAMSGGPDGQGGLFQKIDRLLTENSGKITNTMGNLEEITGKIRRGDGTLGKLVNDPAAYDQLTAALAEIKGAAGEAKLFVTNTQGILEQVKSGKGTLGALIYDEDAGNNIKVTMKNLRDVSEKLNNPNSSFGQLINDDHLMKDAQATLRKVDRAVDGLSDQGPITAVGVVANALF